MTTTASVSDQLGAALRGTLVEGIAEYGRSISPTLLVTPEQALRWLTEDGYQYQRLINKGHVKKLAEANKAGEWEALAIKFYFHNGRLYLVDGQHRLWAIVESGLAAPLTVICEDAETWGDVLNSYRRIDQNSRRNLAAGLAGGAVHESIGVDKQSLSRIASALKVIGQGFRGDRVGDGKPWTIDSIARGAYQWQEDARAYLRVTENASGYFRTRMLMAVPFAFAMITFRYKSEVAETFWTQVASRNRLEQHTGPWHAVDILNGERLANVMRTSYRLASAWNAYYEDRTLLRTAGESDKPIRILGTPYRGSEVLRETF